MRILIAGGAGMLAQDVIGAAQRRGHEVTSLSRRELDITDPTAIDDAIADFRPEAVINCAAWSNVDGAEDDERGAMAINDTGAALLAAGAARVGASILYPSSDYVFDGTKSSWLFGLGGKNFVETMLRIGGEQEEVLVVSDQFGCPTSCADLAEGMLELIGTDNYGIHHIVGEGRCSWFDFARALAMLVSNPAADAVLRR